MLDNFRADIDRYVVLRQKSWVFLVLTEQGLWALAEYRFSSWIDCHIQIPLLRQMIKAISFIWHKIIEILTGISIPCKARIGKGLYIGHFGDIFINDRVIMGENCNLSQGVTIGLGGRGEKRGCPQIGDRVFLGPGAKIFGPLKIGDDVAVGANAVVVKDVPDNAVVVGIPAEIKSYQSSNDYIVYRKK